MNNFYEDLAYSLDISRNEEFDQFYYRILPVKAIEYVDFGKNSEEQKQGIDKKIYLKTGRVLKVDEKVRRKDYGDIFIELISNTKTGKLGWLYYSQCDSIVYYVEPIRKAYWLPMDLLVMAWIENKEEWKRKYKTVEAINKGYKSKGICIPTNVLLKALREQTEKKY